MTKSQQILTEINAKDQEDSFIDFENNIFDGRADHATKAIDEAAWQGFQEGMSVVLNEEGGWELYDDEIIKKLFDKFWNTQL